MKNTQKPHYVPNAHAVAIAEPKLPIKILIGAQILFVAFGALVLVPLLTGLDPSLALLSAGLGTILFHIITGGKVPIFLASSFAFIAPILFGIENYGIGATLGGLIAVGAVYLVLSILARLGGAGKIKKYLPPVVTGPVIMVIGLKLAPVAVNMAKSFDGSGVYDGTALLISFLSLLAAIMAVLCGYKIFKLIPILCGVGAGYLLSVLLGKVDYTPIYQSPWFCNPWKTAIEAGRYAFPVFDPAAILYMLPVAIAPAIEHVGDMLAISQVAGKDFIAKPGLHRTLLGDGLATSLGALVGGPPNTTYSEVTGAVALTKACDPLYMIIAAIFAISLAFIGKLGAALRTIPTPVMGGVMLLLFGMIASIGLKSLISDKTDMDRPRNLIIVSLILVIGIGDMSLSYSRFQLGGIGLAGIVGLLLNLILPAGNATTE
ncbi:MAG: uracil-xanthine permease family protein [Candidatus Cloacimonadaceae bacterium]|nr:uracil-xanthine permease family protein [Candidatus Cloacimonadaceae bacterium]